MTDPNDQHASQDRSVAPDSEVTALLANDPAPEHGPHFWTDLQAAFDEPASPGDEESPERRQASASHSETRLTTELPQTARVAPRRALWPLAVAAALLAVLGLGVVVARNNTSSDATDVAAVAQETAADSASLDGPSGSDDEAAEGGEPQNQEAPQPGENADTQTGDGDTADATEVATPTSSPDTSSTATDAGTGENGSAEVPAIPNFASAPGATGTPDYVPLDQQIPAHGQFLANWPSLAVTWFAVADPDQPCTSATQSEIVYVNGSGITQEVRDPQLRFSGTVAHLTVSDELQRAAWVVACGQQLELWNATLESTGRFDDVNLVWLGEGAVGGALVQWGENDLNLSALDPDGVPFSIEYGLETELLSRNGGPSRIILEEGAPATRSLTPLAASPDGRITYWSGRAPANTDSRCASLFGSGRADTIWLRTGEGQWQPAVAGEFPTAVVSAAAIEPQNAQVAFADACEGEPGRVVIGRQLASGQIDQVTEIDLGPFVYGYAHDLYWVDAQTLRIEATRYSEGDRVRFDYRLDENIFVQLS